MRGRKENTYRKTKIFRYPILCVIEMCKKKINYQITSSFKLDTSKTFDNPRKAPGLFEPKAPVDAKAKAPKLGIPLP